MPWEGWLSDPARTCMCRGLSGPHLHQPAATQEVAGHVADHGANGPEVVLAVGVAPSRRWAQQWYGLVVGMEDTRFVGTPRRQALQACTTPRASLP